MEPSSLIPVAQNSAEADGSAPAADAELGPRAARRPSQPRIQEAPLLRSAGADPEHEGELEPLISTFVALPQPHHPLNSENLEAVVGKSPPDLVSAVGNIHSEVSATTEATK